MIRLKRCFIAVAFSLTGICAANGQSPLPKLQPEVARELFGVYATCNAYWRAMIQCSPSKLNSDDQARLRQTFDQLLAVSVEHMSSLAAKVQLSVGLQQQIKDKATSRVYGGAVVSCNKVSSLIQEYRDKCAALFQNVAAAEKEALSTDQPTEAEVADSAAKFIISTCYEPIDDISRVSSYARAMKWNALSADQKNVMKPVESSFYDAWGVDYDGITYIVSVSRGRFKGRPTEVCQVSVPQRHEPIISRITGTIKTRSIGTNNNGVQDNEMFQLVAHPSVKSGVMIVGRGNDQAFFTIAFMGIK